MRILSVPAGILGVALAIVFFKIYGVLSRPDVPLPVSATVDALAPGVRIGDRVKQVATHTQHLTYVRNLGFVGGLPSHYVPHVDAAVSFSQVRLLLDEKARGRPRPDSSARVAAVELLTASPGAYGGLLPALAATFRAEPASGCVLSSDGSLREVRYWMTRNKLGGAALISDYGSDGPSKDAAAPVVSVVAFTGPFAGEKTLRAQFSPKSCADVDGAAQGNPTTIASDTLTIAFADSVGAASTASRVQLAGANEPLVGGDTLDACIDRFQAYGWTTVSGDGFELDLPDDFHKGASTRWKQEWVGRDYSRVDVMTGGGKHSGWTGGLWSECDLAVTGANAHIDLANASVSTQDFVVHGYYEVPGKSSLTIEAHARSRARQAALLHALRGLRVLPTWDVH